jgi:hypothetical protein
MASNNTDNAKDVGYPFLLFNKYSCYVPDMFMKKNYFGQRGLPYYQGRPSDETKILNAIKSDCQMQTKSDVGKYLFSPYFISNMFNRELSNALDIFGMEYGSAKNITGFGQEMLRYQRVEYSGDSELSDKVNDQIHSRLSEINKIKGCLSGSPPSFHVYYLINKKRFVNEQKSQNPSSHAKVILYSYNRDKLTKP